MTSTFLKAGLLSSSLLILAACGGGGGGNATSAASAPDFFDGPGAFDSSQPVSAGSVDLSTFVAVGDSLTAGFADGSLYRDGQTNSFPNILANLFNEAGGGSFFQPLVSDNLGGLVNAGVPIPDFETRLVLSSSFSPVRQSGTPTTDVTAPIGAFGPFNNVGVPGATLPQILTPALSANPFYGRFASNPGVSSVLTDATAQSPSFFTLWIGNNDLLGFATDGGTNEAVDMTGAGSDQILDTGTFDTLYNTAVGGLTAGSASGVLINIPAIADIPFFTTVPFNAIPLTQAQADAANAAFSAYNTLALPGAVGASLITQAEADQRTINFVAGQNAALILDEGLTDITAVSAAALQFRQATADDAILLTTLGLLGTERTPGDPTTVIGVGSPLLDSEILTAAEIQLIETARAAYNATIQGLAAGSPTLALYDAASDLASVTQGISLSSTSNLSSDFITGGAFSADGVHPTATGYSVIANGIVRTMNIAFGANLPFDDSEQRTRLFFQFPDGSPDLD